ncbi:MAG: alpha/beta hydrolase family protein [Planctomycetaceae bacterium]
MGAPTRPRATSIATVLAVALLCISCERSSPSGPPPGSSAVTFTTSDGVRLSGRLFGPTDASAGVVLAHMLPADQTSWYDEAERLAAFGYRVLTFDFRGYCPGGDGGCSKGPKDVNATPVDLTAALRYLREDGVSRVALVGASMGGTAGLIVASQQGTGVGAVVTLSAPEVIEGIGAGPEVLQLVSAAKLFIAGLGDTTAARSAQAFYDGSQQPKRVEILTTDDHGTDLLTGSQGEKARQLLESWVQTYVPVVPTPAPTAGGAP